MAINYSTAPKVQASGAGSQYANNVSGRYAPTQFTYTAPAGPTKPPTQNVLGVNNFSNTPSSTTNSTQSYQSGIQNIQSQGDAGNSQIEADYNQAMSMLDQSASGLQSQATQAGSVIDTGAADATNQIKNNQTVAEQGTNASLSTAEKQGTSAMQQARDLFRQTQQGNNAQLSALGISSSSVSEALAERLGVETARRIAGVTGSIQEARQNAVNELGRIKTYYEGQVTNLAKQVQDQKAQIQQSLIQGLNQINSARSQAASAKASSRANLISQVQSQIGALTQQQQQFQQSLDQWVAQKNAALTPIVQDPNYLQKLISTANTLNAQPEFSKFGVAVPNVNVDKNGIMTGQINTQKKPNDPNDLLSKYGIGAMQ